MIKVPPQKCTSEVFPPQCVVARDNWYGKAFFVSNPPTILAWPYLWNIDGIVAIRNYIYVGKSKWLQLFLNILGGWFFFWRVLPKSEYVALKGFHFIFLIEELGASEASD